MAAPYALAPALVTDEPLDYRTVENRKIYKAATAPLWNDQFYDLSPSGLFPLMESLVMRGHTYGWTQNPGGCMYVPENPESQNLPNEALSYFFDSYATLELVQIQQWEVRMVDDETKAGQDSHCLFHAIMNSLDTDARTTLMLEKQDYELQSADGATIQGGLALLKIITNHVLQESPGMAAILRTELNNIQELFLKLDSDVQAFNQQVKLLIKRLNRLGQRENADDLLLNLFAAYEDAQDEEFAKYIKDRHSEHEDGRRVLDHTSLMAVALAKYKLLKRQGRWKAPTPTQEKLTALQAKLTKIENKVATAKKKVAFAQQENNNGKGKGGATPSNNKKDRPDWLRNNTPPTGKWLKGDTPRHWNGIDWYWCSKETGGKCEGHWRRHKPSDCKGTAKKRGAHNESGGGNQQTKKKPKMILAQAARAVLEQGGIDPDEAFEEQEEE